MSWLYDNGTPWQSQYGDNATQSGDIGSWSAGTALPVSAWASRVIVTDSKVIILGGKYGSTMSNDIYISDIAGDGTIGTFGIEFGAAYPFAGAFGQTVATGDTVHVIGGATSGGVTDSVYTGTIDGTGEVWSWAAGTSLPASRSLHSAIVTSSRVYVIGGIDSVGGYYDSTISADVSDGTIGTWSAGTTLPLAIADAAVTRIADRVFLIGGVDEYGDLLNTIYVATIDEDGYLGAWSLYGTFSAYVRSAQIVTTDSQIYVIGGHRGVSPSDYVSDEVTIATITDGDIGTWSAGTAMSAAKEYFSVFATSSKIYAIGGLNVSEAPTSVVSVASFSGGSNDYTAMSYEVIPDTTYGSIIPPLTVISGTATVEAAAIGRIVPGLPAVSGTATATISANGSIVPRLPVVKGYCGCDAAIIPGLPAISGTAICHIAVSANISPQLPVVTSLAIGGIAAGGQIITKVPKLSGSADSSETAQGHIVPKLPTISASAISEMSASGTISPLLPRVYGTAGNGSDTFTALSYTRPCAQ